MEKKSTNSSPNKRCKHCPESFTKWTDLSAHVKSYHPEKCLSCVICDPPKVFINNQSLNKHRFNKHKKHLKTRKKGSKSKSPSKSPNKSSAVADNSSQQQSIKNPHKCLFCTKKFNHAGNKKRHMKLAHKEKYLNCPDCQQNILKSNLANHRAVKHKRLSSSPQITPLKVKIAETNIQLNQCEECPSSFKTSFALKRHVKNAHPRHFPVLSPKIDGKELDFSSESSDDEEKQLSKKTTDNLSSKQIEEEATKPTKVPLPPICHKAFVSFITSLDIYSS